MSNSYQFSGTIKNNIPYRDGLVLRGGEKYLRDSLAKALLSWDIKNTEVEEGTGNLINKRDLIRDLRDYEVILVEKAR